MPEITKSRYLVTAGWDDVPHLDPTTKAELLESTPPYLRDARSKGTPSLGSGAIYPIALSDITTQPFPIPAYWPRAYALDVGWNRTAALWGAWDPTDWTMYCYAEHYMGEELPVIHAEAIKARGKWIPGVIDPASRGRSQSDGKALFQTYSEMGLMLTVAENAVEAGLHEVWSALSFGRIKVFSNLKNFGSEYRLYRRDENGKIVKKHDHLMDCLRYLWMSGKDVARVMPVKRSNVVQLRVADGKAGY